jgi:hypothetical protein
LWIAFALTVVYWPNEALEDHKSFDKMTTYLREIGGLLLASCLISVPSPASAQTTGPSSRESCELRNKMLVLLSDLPLQKVDCSKVVISSSDGGPPSSPDAKLLDQTPSPARSSISLEGRSNPLGSASGQIAHLNSTIPLGKRLKDRAESADFEKNRKDCLAFPTSDRKTKWHCPSNTSPPDDRQALKAIKSADNEFMDRCVKEGERRESFLSKDYQLNACDRMRFPSIYKGNK